MLLLKLFAIASFASSAKISSKKLTKLHHSDQQSSKILHYTQKKLGKAYYVFFFFLLIVLQPCSVISIPIMYNIQLEKLKKNLFNILK